MAQKRYDGYRSFQYLEAGKDYRAFELRRRARLAEHPIVSMHDHTAIAPEALFGDHVGLHHAFAEALSIGRITEGLEYPRVEYVAGMENPGEAMRNAVGWMVKHGWADADIAKVAGGNALRVLRETWAR